MAQADVSLEKAQAVVSFDENKVQPAVLVEAVEDAGFDAAVAWVLFIAYLIDGGVSWYRLLIVALL